MPTLPPVTNFALLLGLSLFLGLAFEEFFAHDNARRPGGIRTFPILAIAGGMLYLFDPKSFVPFTAGLLVLGAWMTVFYTTHIRERDEKGEANVGIVVLLLNVHAYLLGAIALAMPNWLAVATTVAAVLLLTGREQLHALASRVEQKEINTAVQFLILSGIILPLLPGEKVTTLTSVTPRQVWLALVVVCAFSYASYLAQRYWPRAAAGLWTAALGGLYSSTATTVVLARKAKSDPASRDRALAGITLATGIMYLRILAIVAVFDFALGLRLATPMIGLSLVAMIVSALQYKMMKTVDANEAAANNQNPLEVAAAATFAVIFVVISLVSTWVTTQFGSNGVYWLAAIIGVADIDPFVLNLAQGGISGITTTAISAAILIATASNNLMKATYTLVFGGVSDAAPAAAVLVLLACASFAIALRIAGVV